MKINFNPYITYNKINFKGNRDVEDTHKNPLGTLIHETCFFREPRTDYIIKDYVLKNFLNEPKIKIVNGACSSGEETYTQAMLLSEMKDKVDISGFDISPKTIEQAKEGLFTVHRLEDSRLWNISSAWHDSFLVDKYGWLSAQQQEQKELFYKYFKPMDNQTDVREKQDFKANDEIKKMCNFKVGDIKNLSKMYDKNSIHVLTFKNALYHLVCEKFDGMRRPMIYGGREIIKDIVKQAHTVLKPNGIFVFGENEERQGIDNQMIYRIMTQNGFEPAIELSKGAKKAKRCNVWKKI